MSSDSQLMPFLYNTYSQTPILSIALYGDYAFAGTGDSGMVIRSKDRYSWEKYYQTEDTNISALKIVDGYLYIGTSPNGLIYKINLLTLSVEKFDSIGSSIVDFVLYSGSVYVATNGPIAIKKLNPTNNKWDFVYTPHASINQMSVFDNRIYLALESGNFIYFDGSHWSKEQINNGIENISSYKKVTGSAFGSFPTNKSDGIKSLCKDGTSIVIGSSNFTRLYSLIESKLDMIFDTEGDGINNILNLDLGVNLVSNGNKVFLVSSGEATENLDATTTTTTTQTQEDPNANKTVVMTYPNGGEIIQLGDSVNIQWSSTKGINDAIKLELVAGSTVVNTIVSQTSNSGSFFWDVPLSLTEGSLYKIRITWLSAGESQEINVDESDETFSVVKTIVATTTTTTTQLDPLKPNISSVCGIPILVLPEYESITKMILDDYTQGVLFTTSEGRILGCDILTINGYLTGERKVYADVYDGLGYSGSSFTVYLYSLYKKIVEINEEKVIQKWKYANDFGTIKTETITAVFQGPILEVKNDFGFWKELSWEENKPEDSDITIYLRSGSTTEELLGSTWKYSAVSETDEIGTITRNLNNIGLNGRFIQIKIEILVNIKDIVPSITNVILRYSTKDSSYFFTNKFTVDLDNPSQKGFLTATISQPQDTEIAFGITSGNTTEWNDYQIITPDKFFDFNSKEFRVGIKFSSHDANIPEVAEFAIMVGGEVLKPINY